MGKRKTKVGGVAKPASAVAAANPPRARNFDHLKNKKLHGLEFGLTQRNNILIDCWAADRVPQSVIIECFEKAGIYPPGASAALVSDEASNRNSRRIQKMEAGKELQRIATDMTLSTDQRITQCSEVLEDIMELSKYEQLSPEKLCPQKRKKKRSGNKHGSISPSPSPSPSRPAYKNVIGNFSPGAMHNISDSFAQEREEWSNARLFICSVEGCDFGLRGAPSRFSSEGYLRSHMKLKHGVVLAPMNANDVKELKRQQQAPADFDSHVPLSPVALPDGVNPFKIDARAGLSLGMFECVGCGFQTEDTLVDMAQHFWSEHPEWTFGGQRIRRLQTGDEFHCNPPEEMPTKEATDILRRWLGNDSRLFDFDKMAACWDAIVEDVTDADGCNSWDAIPDYDRVAAALEASGNIRPGKYDAKKKTGRKCSKCQQPGHDKRNCPMNAPVDSIDSPLHSPMHSPMHSPLHSPTYSPPASPIPHAQSPTTPPTVCTSKPEKRSCSLQ
jgi:hypothetical protein